MSDWRPKQGPASFRGVPFYVESGEQAGGRHAPVHEIPGSEDPPVDEDLGRKGRTFTVEAYVLGTEYEKARDALLTALETQGPGELVHPYFGTRTVTAVTYRVRQQRAKGGIASFSIEFRETSTPAAPTATVAVVPLAHARADAFESMAGGALMSEHSFLPPGNLAAVLPDAEFGFFDDVLGELQHAIDSLPVPSDLRAAFSRLSDGGPLSGFASAAEQLVGTLGGLFEAAYEAVRSSTSPIDPTAIFLRLAAIVPSDRPVGTSPSVATERADFDSLHTFVERVSIAYAARATLEQAFVSFDDAVRVRDTVLAAIDVHIDRVADDGYAAAVDLRAALVEAVPGAASDLPQLQRYTPPATLPSLVLAHELYGNLEREEDLIQRNHLRHPGFVPGGHELEVLSDG